MTTTILDRIIELEEALEHIALHSTSWPREAALKALFGDKASEHPLWRDDVVQPVMKIS